MLKTLEFSERKCGVRKRGVSSNGHGKGTPPDNEASHARFPDEPTSHSTRLLKDSNQVAGYLPNPTHEPPPQNGFRRVRLRTNVELTGRADDLCP